MREDPWKKPKLTMFSALILFVFLILAVATILAGLLALGLHRYGVYINSYFGWFPVSLIVLFGPSVVIGTVLAALGGRWVLKPFRRMVKATQEIATGNFDVRLPEIRMGPGELRLLNHSFNEMAQELGSIETLRNDFVSSISHEFKTPVTSIKGFAKLLKRDDLLPERRKEYLDIIIVESERLSRLSSNVLLLSKLEAQDTIGQTVVFSLDEQIRRAILLLEPQCRQKDLELVIDLDEASIDTNEELLHQVWLNLLSNAVKFTEPGGRIIVSLRREPQSVVAVIADTGVGIEPDVRKRLFDKFYQGDKSRFTEGNGLGLSLVRRILELCGGSIRVESEVGRGSRFSVELPVPPAETIR